MHGGLGAFHGHFMAQVEWFLIRQEAHAVSNKNPILSKSHRLYVVVFRDFV